MASAEHMLSEGKFVDSKKRRSALATKAEAQPLTQAKEGEGEHAAAGALTNQDTHSEAEVASDIQRVASGKTESGGSEPVASKVARMNVVGKGSSQLVMPDLEKTLYPDKVRQNPKRFKIKENWKGYHLPAQDDVDGLNKKDEGFEIEKPPCGDECRAEKLAFEKKKAELIAQQPWTGSGMLTAAEQEKAIDRMGQGKKLVVGIINSLDEDSEDKGIKHVADIHTISRLGKVRFGSRVQGLGFRIHTILRSSKVRFTHLPAVSLARFPDPKSVYFAWRGAGISPEPDWGLEKVVQVRASGKKPQPRGEESMRSALRLASFAEV